MVALRERLARLRGRGRSKGRRLRDDLREIGERCARLPTLDDRSEDEILGFDERGVPRSMVLDTSALLALLLDEPEAETFRVAVEEDPVRLVSAATLLETSIVIEARKGDAGTRELDLLVRTAGVDVASVDADQVFLARRAYQRFGRGRHAAGLNFGDVFSYALARASGEPLLFKGDAFARTDIPRVL